MTSEAAFNDVGWYLIQTHVNQEDRAAENLEAWRVPVCNPKIRAKRRLAYVDKFSFVTKPLFPRYIFAQFRINDLYHKIRYTRGVHSLVRFGDYPAPVNDDVIEVIRAKADKNGFVAIGGHISPGDRVMIEEGPWKNFLGVFEREMKDSDRVEIMLEAVNHRTRIVLPKDYLRRMEASA